MPRGGGRIYLATGYDKWGMTNAVAAALRIAAPILGGDGPGGADGWGVGAERHAEPIRSGADERRRGSAEVPGHGGRRPLDR